MAADELRMTLAVGEVGGDAASEVQSAGAMELVPAGQAADEAASIIRCWNEAIAEEAAHGPFSGATVREAAKLLTAAFMAISVRFDTVSAAQQEQMRGLTWIRQTCDEVAGVKREREDKRMPGAKGAVTVLIARFRALQAKLEASEAARRELAAEVRGLRRQLRKAEAERDSASESAARASDLSGLGR